MEFGMIGQNCVQMKCWYVSQKMPMCDSFSCVVYILYIYIAFAVVMLD